MSLNKFEEPTERILSSENLQNLQTIKNNRNLIDKNLLEESKKFVSHDPHSVKFKEEKPESTEEIDHRIKKFNEIDERLKKFTKNMKKHFKQTDKHCDLHRKVEPTELSVYVNEFMEKDLSVPNVESVLKRDEDFFQQHESNIEKIKKLMETVSGYKHDEVTMPAAAVVNDSIRVLSETVSDIDYLNESSTMYNGLSGEAPKNPFTEEIKELIDNLYIQ